MTKERNASTQRRGQSRTRSRNLPAAQAANVSAETTIPESIGYPHISDDWMSGYTYHPEAAMPAFVARRALNGISESAARKLWGAVRAALDLWALEHGAPPAPRIECTGPHVGLLRSSVAIPEDASGFEPWERGGPGVHDYIDLLELLKATPAGYAEHLFSELPYTAIIAVTILHELSRGDSTEIALAAMLGNGHPNGCNRHLVCAMKGRMVLEIANRDSLIEQTIAFISHNAPKIKQRDAILARGRKQGAEYRAKQAERNRHAIWDFARSFFRSDPRASDSQCAAALLDASRYPDVQKYLVVNGRTKSRMKASTLIKKFAGAREAALIDLSDQRPALIIRKA